MQTPQLFEPFLLPSGERLRNRVVKAAMEEHLGEPGMLPGSRLRTLYQRWADGGVGAIITGNVMIDARAATSPAGVALENGMPLTPFVRWADSAKSGGAAAWMQLSHPGRQVKADQRGVALSPSGIGIEGSGFASPRAMDQDDIREVIGRFARSAALAAEAGFTGVQVHGAHGYLLNQFLSPLANRRTDDYGGSIRNRARLLLDVIDAVRNALPGGTTVAVKLNTADFQRGGFDADDAIAVVGMLNGLGVDLLELSGGNASSPAMHGPGVRESTRAREAYFLELSANIVEVARIPLMLTGGISSPAVSERVLSEGFDVVGIASALAMTPDLADRWASGSDNWATLPDLSDFDLTGRHAATQAITRWMLRRWAASPAAPPTIPPPQRALAAEAVRRRRLLPRYHALLQSRASPAEVCG